MLKVLQIKEVALSCWVLTVNSQRTLMYAEEIIPEKKQIINQAIYHFLPPLCSDLI